jgi:hypothetical protein
VVADQFAKRGIVSDRARDMALKITDSGSDLAMLGNLGIIPPDLKKRAQMLVEVRARATAPIVAAPRNVLKKAQPLLMGVGDAFVYPIHRRELFGDTAHRRIRWECINPYFASKQRSSSGDDWTQEGWAACEIVDTGRAFEKLRRTFPAMGPGIGAAVSDTSIANRLNIMDLSVYLEKLQMLPNIQPILAN